ncbi:MAG: beta-glucanase (GH16 family), partial [Flavobacteriales bacterium]
MRPTQANPSQANRRTRLKTISRWLLTPIIGAAIASIAHAQVGQLLWEDNFDGTSLNNNQWNINEGDGCPNLCNWGNGELQWYSGDNIAVNGGNLVFEARDEPQLSTAHNGKRFSSAKINSKGHLSVQYGMIEARVQVPTMGIGLWPAVWLLGADGNSWPSVGEIDMMEMGHRRDGIIEAGHGSADLNNYVGSNSIFWHQDACVPGNPTCAAHTSFGKDNAYESATPLSNRFVTYRLYWTETNQRFTVEDNGIEHTMHESGIGEGMDAFKRPYYLLLNLAVGGFFTDALSDAEVQAPFPGQMLVDYVRVYEYDGQGQVWVGEDAPPPEAETGTFGVYTDTTPRTDELNIATDSFINIWNAGSVAQGNISPIEGANVIAWNYFTPAQWFGGSIDAREPRNLSNFTEGNYVFDIQIPGDAAFRIGIADGHGNEGWIEFPANQNQYGLARNGSWGTVSIPVSDITGTLIDLRFIKSHFRIAQLDGQLPNFAFEFALDNIRWEGGGSEVADSDGDGVNDDDDLCPNTSSGVIVDNSGCEITPISNIRIEAENFIRALDTSPGNSGSNSGGGSGDVDTETTSDIDGGLNVGWTAAGEWLEYDLVLAAGRYNLTSRVASQGGGGSYDIAIVNGNTLSTNTVVATGGWQEWISQENGEVDISTTDTYTLRVDINAPGFNLNWVELESLGCNDPTCLDSDNDGISDAIDSCPNTPAGVAVDTNGCTLVIDSDGDGVPDNQDSCPNTPAGVVVDGNGCTLEIDSDADGVPDNQDNCPN